MWSHNPAHNHDKFSILKVVDIYLCRQGTLQGSIILAQIVLNLSVQFLFRALIDQPTHVFKDHLL